MADVPLTFGTLPGGVNYCVTTWQQLGADIIAATTATFSGTYSVFNYGPATPAVGNQDYPWFKTDGVAGTPATYKPIGWYTYYSGAWYRMRNELLTDLSATNVADAYAMTISDYRTEQDLRGFPLAFKASATNTGAATLNVTAGGVAWGPQPITKNGTSALVAGDIVDDSIVMVIWDGTQFQLVSEKSAAPQTVSIALVQYQEANNTPGEDIGNVSPNTIPLNTTVLDPDGIITALAAGVMDLAAGTYLIDGYIQVHHTDTEFDQKPFLLEVYNDDDATVIESVSYRGGEADDTDVIPIKAAFTLAAAKSIKIRLLHETHDAGDIALGIASNLDGQPEVYSQFTVTKYA